MPHSPSQNGTQLATGLNLSLSVKHAPKSPSIKNAPVMSRYSSLLVSSALALVLVGCGGGGGGGSATISQGPSVNLTQPPAPPTNPNNNQQQLVNNRTMGDKTQFETIEYRNSWGLGAIKASTAYAQGLTGQGVVIGIIDTGIDMNNAEFAGALHAASINIVTGRREDLQDASGHGTWVASVAGGRKNNSVSHGVAYNSTILAVNASTAINGCGQCFYDRDIAAGVRYASLNGAKIINMSLGSPNAMGTSLTDAMREAAGRGNLLVAAAGNEGAITPNYPGAYAGLNGIAGSMIIAGSLEQDNSISTFSNRAGASMNYYLAAPGRRLTATDIGGGPALVSGTSFAAPTIAGAAALIMENWAQLTGAQVADILLSTATDLGDAGTDAVYGRGMLNLENALRPQGTLSVPTASSVQAGGTNLAQSNLVLGGAFGNSLANASSLKQVAFVDSYQRDYTTDLTMNIKSASVQSGLSAWLRPQAKSTSGAVNVLGFGVASFSSSDNSDARTLVEPKDQGRSMQNTQMAFTSQMGEKSSMTLSQGHSLNSSLGLTGSVESHAPLATANVFGSPYLALADGGEAANYATELKNGMVVKLGIASSNNNNAARTAYVAEISKAINTGLTLGVQVGSLREEGGALGSSSSGALAFGGSDTKFAGAFARYALNNKVQLVGQYNAGLTETQSLEGSLLSDFSAMRSQSFSLGLLAEDVWHKDDRLTMAVSQPIRTLMGSALAKVPVGVDRNGGVSFKNARVSLAPSASQIDFQTGYTAKIAEGEQFSVNFLTSFNPGHESGASTEVAVGFKYRLQF